MEQSSLSRLFRYLASATQPAVANSSKSISTGKSSRSTHAKSVTIPDNKDVVCIKCGTNKASIHRRNGNLPNGQCSKCNSKDKAKKDREEKHNTETLTATFSRMTVTEPVAERTRSKTKQTISLSLKTMVWNKYIGLKYGLVPCMCCRTEPIKQISHHAGHVVAESNGGETNIDNLRPICATCNLSMGNQNMIDYMKRNGFDRIKYDIEAFNK